MPAVCVCVNTNDGCKELWRRAAGCHEGGSRHVLAQVQFLPRKKNKTRNNNIAEDELLGLVNAVDMNKIK